MSLRNFVRCRFCGMPHEATDLKCPQTGQVLMAAKRLAARQARRLSLEGKRVDDKYKILEMIGEGGMGVVYRARNQVLETEVALKVLHDSLQEDTAARRRFEREGFVGGALSHPNLVKLFDAGVLPDGRPFLVMELLDGEPLSERIERETMLGVADAVFVAEHVLQGLAATHDQGIVHRDVKPDNIFLRDRLAGVESVKLIDFSVSKFVEEATRVSLEGEVLGTAEYLAPEQAMGRRDLDHRVDIWATGVVMYEMLVGQPPFRGESLLETVSGILEIQPLCPGDVRSDVDPSLDALVMKALSKDPADRFPTARAMVEAVRSVGGSDTLRPTDPPSHDETISDGRPPT